MVVCELNSAFKAASLNFTSSVREKFRSPTRMAAVVLMVLVGLGMAQDAKGQVVEITGTSLPGSTIAPDPLPMDCAPLGNFLTMWTPQQLQNTTGHIVEFGFQFRTAFGTKSWSNIKIWFGRTTRTSGISISINAPSPVFLTNFSATGQPVLCYDGPVTLVASTTGAIPRIVLQTPYHYTGTENLCMYMEVSGGSATPSALTAKYATSAISPAVLPNFRVVNGTTHNTTGTLENSVAHGAGFLFGTPANPAIVVNRGAKPIANGSVDDVGPVGVQGAAIPLTYTMTNPGTSNNLNVTGITVGTMVNCVATVSPPVPTSVPFGNVPVPFTVNVTATSTGTFSFRITIANNSQVVADQQFVIPVAGTAVVNATPTLASPTTPIGGTVSGTFPNFVIETLQGNSLDFTITGSDPNTFQPLIVSAVVASGGNLTPANAGFTTTFPASTPQGVGPLTLTFAGTALAIGEVKFNVTATDNATPGLATTIQVTVKIGARADVVSAIADSPYFRLNSRKDVYRGQPAINVNVNMANPNPFPVSLQALTIEVRDFATNTLVTGTNVSFPAFPITIPPFSTAFQITGSLTVASNASGSNGMPCKLQVVSATVVDPAAPTTNLIVVLLPTVLDEFDLRNAPAPNPLTLSTVSLATAADGNPYFQELIISGGSGNYTWGLSPGSAAQLPNGLSLTSNGSSTIPANLSGTLATGTSAQSPYLLTFDVNDGTHKLTVTYSLTVIFVSPLTLVTSSLPNGQEYMAYSMPSPLTATGGIPPYTFSVDPSSLHPLPLGLSLNATSGLITGIPANGTSGVKSITFAVSDTNTTVTKVITLQISLHALFWRTTTVPSPTRLYAYSSTLDAIGGFGAREYLLEAGVLPPGLSLSPLGVVSGTASVGGAFPVTFKVRDGLGSELSQAMTITVVEPTSVVITNEFLPNIEIGVPYQVSLGASGGTGTYTFSIPNPKKGLPSHSLTLAPNGVISGTVVGSIEGRFEVSLQVSDGITSSTRTFLIGIVSNGARNVRISELDVSTGYVEISNTGVRYIDVSAWQVRVWVDSMNPLAMPFDTLPTARTMLPGGVVSISFGGIAGGQWPSFNAGVALTASSQSTVGIELMDFYGNTLDFLRVGNVPIQQLLDATGSPIALSAAALDAQALPVGSNNYSLDSTGYTGGVTGTFGVYNSGLPTVPLSFAKNALRATRFSESYQDWVIAKGGVPPYSYAIIASNATWLSMNATTGLVSGTVPSTGITTPITMSFSVTDAVSATATASAEFDVSTTTAFANAELYFGGAEMYFESGSVASIPVQLFRHGGGQVATHGFSFEIVIPTVASGQFELLRARPNWQLANAGLQLSVRPTGADRYLVTSHWAGAPTHIGDLPAVALIDFWVPAHGPNAVPALHQIELENASVYSPGNPFLTDGSTGLLSVHDFKPQDVNRDRMIDVVDVQVVVNIILSTAMQSYMGQGDADSDGWIDVVDIQVIVNCILTGGC